MLSEYLPVGVERISSPQVEERRGSSTVLRGMRVTVTPWSSVPLEEAATSLEML